LGNVDETESTGGRISVELTGLSPLFKELFMETPESDARPVSSRAFIGASRAEFRLFDTTVPELETRVDSWSMSIADMNSGSGSDYIRTANHSVHSSINLDGRLFRLEVDIFNDTVSSTIPAVTGSKSPITIIPDINNSVPITCVPTTPVDLVSGTQQPVAIAPFVLVDSLVTTVGGEAWYKIVVTEKRLTLTCTVDALNTSTVAGVLYDSSGAAVSISNVPIKFSATTSQPFSKIFTLSSTVPTTPVTYYLGVAQSRQLGAGSNFGFTISATDGPADPAPPTLTPGVGTITASWESDPTVGSYTLYYGIPGYANQYGVFQGQPVYKIEAIPATEGIVSQIVALPPTSDYGFWLEWKKDGITAGSPGITWTTYDTQAVGTTNISRALHAVSTVNTEWTCEAIGSIPDGSASYDAGVYTMTGAGVLGLSGDDPRPTWLQFLHQPVTSDFTIQLRVVSIGDNGDTSDFPSFAQAGIAVRSNLTPESVEMLQGVEFGAYYTGSGDPIVWTAVPQQSINLTYPQTGEGNNSTISNLAVPAPVWLKVTRVGTLVESWYSIDDCVTWTEVNPMRWDEASQAIVYDDMQFDGTVELGMYVIGNNWDTQVTAVFDTVTITTP